jgi:hypothetical protein
MPAWVESYSPGAVRTAGAFETAVEAFESSDLTGEEADEAQAATIPVTTTPTNREANFTAPNGER